MHKFLICYFFAFLISSNTFAQKDSTDKQIMDSLIQNDEFLKMLNNFDDRVSYLKVSASIGNSLLDNNNRALQSFQKVNHVVFSPSIGYFHKSGFGVSLTGYLMNENEETKFYQYTVSPSYEYTKSDIVNAYVFYTHYFVRDIYNVSSSPVQNDLYGGVVLKKSFINPGISLGYSSGRSDEIIKIDTLLKIQNRNRHVKYIDTANILLKSFAITGSVEHVFNFFGLISSNDELSFIPQISVVAGINTYKTEHNSSLSDFNAFTKKKLMKIRNFYTQSANQKWLMQSLGCDLDLNYSIGKFSFEPELYLSYYLPKTFSKRVTQIFNFNFGMTF